MRLILFLCVAVLVVRPTRTVPEFCVGTLGATSAVVASYHAREAVVCLSFLLVAILLRSVCISNKYRHVHIKSWSRLRELLVSAGVSID